MLIVSHHSVTLLYIKIKAGNPCMHVCMFVWVFNNGEHKGESRLFQIQFGSFVESDFFILWFLFALYPFTFHKVIIIIIWMFPFSKKLLNSLNLIISIICYIFVYFYKKKLFIPKTVGRDTRGKLFGYHRNWFYLEFI